VEREAIIRLIAEGVNRAVSDLKKAENAVGSVGSKGSMASSALQEIGRVAFRVASDVSRAFNDVKPIDFGRAGDSARNFSDRVAQYAQRFGADAGSMRAKFMGVGEQIGVSSERVAGFTRRLSEITATDASGAVKELGTYANETGRDLEEVGEVGATLINKLGVPVDKVGDSLQRLKDIAQDFSTVGGSLALERSLMRVAPMLARLGGTFGQKAGLVAELGKGQAPEVAAETTQAVTGYLAHLDSILATRKLRQLTRDANYRPMEQDEQGRFVWKPEAIATLQKHFRRIPKSALYQAFGRSIEGVQAAEAFIDADLGEAAQAGSSAPSAAKPTEGERQRLKRAQTDVERANVEIKVGEKVVEQQAKRNEIYKGHRKIQAAVDTVKSYIPSRAAGVVDIAEAAVVEDVTNYQKWKDQPVTSKVGAGSTKGAAATATATVEIGPASIANLARAIAKSPIIAKPNKSTAAQAVEDSKAKNRSGANF
jgi:hypothetical protein